MHHTFIGFPFGLTTTCYISTNLMHLEHWHSQGIRALVYNHDDIVAVKGEAQVHQVSKMVQTDLERAGFLTNIQSGTIKMYLLVGI